MQIAQLQKCIDGAVEVYLKNTDGEYAYYCFFHKFQSEKPDYRYKYVMINCCKYRIEWIKE